jgi:hypothetical protein
MCALGTALEVGSVSCLRRIRDAEVYRAIPDCSTAGVVDFVTRTATQRLRPKQDAAGRNLQLRGGGPGNGLDHLGSTTGNDFLRGGGENEILPDLQKVGEQVWKVLDKQDGGAFGSSYYEKGDQALQQWCRSLETKAREAQHFATDVVLPSLEDTALHAYYLARHPAEAQAALEACARSSLDTARSIKNSIPGVETLPTESSRPPLS